MSNLLSILNPDDNRRRSNKLQIQLVSPTDSLQDPPSSPESVSSEIVDELDAEPLDHEPHPNCPDTLNCLPDTDGRPQHTLPVILRCAILGSPRKRLTIREIYAAMENKYSYYRTAGPTWKQSVRHHLSLNRLFERQPRPVTDPGFGSYWTVNLEAPPGTKRPRKRGRAVKVADADPKKRGRPRKDEVPVAFDLSLKDTRRDTDDCEMASFAPERHIPESHEEFESEEETVQHPFERRASLAHMQLSHYPQPPSTAPPRAGPSNEERINTVERLNMEISTLRRQTADAVQVSVRLTEQLAQAQAETNRVKSVLKRAEGMVGDETRKRREAEEVVENERRLRRAAELEVKSLRIKLSECLRPPG